MKSIFKKINSNWFLIIVISCFLLIRFITSNNYNSVDYKITLLGAEYTTIANSIIEGNGYSNPFHYETGPTSWMPPLLVYLEVFVFLIFGISYYAYITLTLIKFAGFILTFYILVKTLDLLRIPYQKIVLAIIFMLYLYLGNFQIFELCMEHWLYLLIGALLLYSFLSYIKEGKKVYLIAFLFLIAPLSTPALFIPMSIILLLIFIKFLFKKKFTFFQISPSICLRHFILFGFLSTFSITLWAYRNYKVFNTIILSKPNTWFEFYLSNIKDNTGILQITTFENYHPLFSEKMCNDMYKMGESNWLKQYKDSAKLYILNHKTAYLKKVKFRAYNIFGIQKRSDNRFWAEKIFKIPRTDKLKLIDNKLVKGDIDSNKLLWNILYLENDTAYRLFKSLNLTETNKIYKDFQYAKKKLDSFNRHTIYGFVKAGLPFLSLLFLIIFFFKKETEFVIISSLIYFIYFIPFILISFTERYQLFILEYQSLFVALVISILINKMWNTNTNPNKQANSTIVS